MATEETGGTGTGHRSVSITRTSKGRYAVTNARGGTIAIGDGENADFTPVELLLTAIAGCSGVDVDFITSKRAEPTTFDITSEGVKVRDEQGNHLTDIKVTFSVQFPDGAEGDAAREALPKSIQMSHDRLCTVSRTVLLGTPIEMVAN